MAKDIYIRKEYIDSLRQAADLPIEWEKLRGRSLLIAGATGLIGRCLVDLLMYQNEENNLDCHIYAIGRSEEAAERRLKGSYFNSPYFTFISHDVKLPLDGLEISGADYILHLASNTHPAAYAAEPVDTIMTNIYGLKNLLDFGVKYSAGRFVFLSSVEVYGENRGDVEMFPEDYMGYLDCNTLRAGYPESKRCGEALCQAYIAEKGMDIVIPRLPRVYGPTMLETDSKAAAQFLKKAVRGEDIVLKSEGNQHYSFLHVLDAVTGILTVMLKGKCGEAYNIAEEGNDATLKELAELAAGLAGRKVVYELPDESERKGYSTATRARIDGSRIRSLGWKPFYSVRDGFKNTVDILRNDRVKVSVIIPVYNTSAYLKQCLDSVSAQTLKELEIICVDDGSSDDSPEILDAYAAKCPRMRVIHKENGGVVLARRTGELAARGEYIGYVDSDDWIDEKMYERLYTCAAEHEAELVSSGYWLEGNYTSECLDGIEGGMYAGGRIKELRENTIYCMKKKDTGLRAPLPCKLFSKKLIERIPVLIPGEVTMSEDKLQTTACVLECRSAYIIKESYYHYRINQASATRRGNPSYLLCVDQVYQYFRKLYEHPDFTERMKQQAELYIMDMLLVAVNTRLGFTTRNLLWIDPYWLEQIPEGKRIVLYGAGEAGRKYRTQLLEKGRHMYAGCIDFEHDRIQDEVLKVQSPKLLTRMEYDCIVITIKNAGKAEEVRERLKALGVENSRILWFEQKELFWKYAEAEGLLEGGI